LYAINPVPNVNVRNEVFALDSTTISLSLKLFTWAPGKYSRGAIKIHTLLDLRGNIPSFILVTDGKYHDSNILDELLVSPGAIYIMDKAYIDFAALYDMNESGAFFISRAKSTMDYTVIESNFNIDPTSGLRSDKTIILNGYKSSKLYPEPLRLVEYYDDEKEILLSFLSNNDMLSALEIAKLYKKRWQVEIFFKWVKQNLTIKTLWGRSENAVNIHIWVAISTYLIVAYLKHTLKSNLSIYETMQILGISAFDKTPLKELLTECQINQNVNEQWNLFDE
jgi:transposase